jgi:uncharacterized protein YkwD
MTGALLSVVDMSAMKNNDDDDDDASTSQSSNCSSTYTSNQCSIVSQSMQSPQTKKARLQVYGHVNTERVKSHRLLKPLQRCGFLETLATLHVLLMSKSGTVYHSCDDLVELRSILHSNRVGENVRRGRTLKELHVGAMTSTDKGSKRNILSSRYTEMGAAVSKGADGKIYLCQLFRQ